MKSKISLRNKIDNKDRKFGSCLYYHPVSIIKKDGKHYNALFTDKEIEEALERASKNKEDFEKSIDIGGEGDMY